MADLTIGLMQPNPTLRLSASAVLRHSLIAKGVLNEPLVGEGSPVALYRQAVQQEHAQLMTQCEAVRERTAANAVELKRLQCLKQFFEEAANAQLLAAVEDPTMLSTPVGGRDMRESSDLDLDLDL